MKHCKTLLYVGMLALLAGMQACTVTPSPTLPLPDWNSRTVGSLLSSDDVTAFVMDKSHKMWIGTSYGLNLYDGYRYYQYFHNDTDSLSLPGNKVVCLLRDSRERVWVGTTDGLAVYEENVGFHSLPHAEGMKYEVKQIEETSDGRLVVRLTDEICELENGRLVPRLENIGVFWRMETDNRGGVWVISPDDVAYYDAAWRQTRRKENPLSANMAYSVKDGNRLWLSQSRSIACIDLETQKEVYRSERQLDILPNLLFPDGDGLLVKSDKHGFFRFNLESKRLEAPTCVDSLGFRRPELLSCLYRDDDGNLWAGFDNAGFGFVSTMDRSVNAANRNSLYAATRDRYMVTLAEAPGGVLWGGTTTDVFRYDAARDDFRAFSQEQLFTDSPWFRQTLLKVAPSDSGIWLLTNVRIVLARHGGNRLQVEYSHNLGTGFGDCAVAGETCYVSADSPYLYAARADGRCDSVAVPFPQYNSACRLLCLRDGRLLLGMQGLEFAVYDPVAGQFQKLEVTPLPQRFSVQPAALYEDRAGRVWVGSNGQGLFCLSLPQLKLDVVPSLPALQVMSIVEDDGGVLWLGTRKGVMSYDPATRAVYLYAVRAETDRVYRVFQEGCIARLGDAFVLGSDKGCVSVHTSAMKHDIDPHLEIRRVYIRNEARPNLALPRDKGYYVLAYNQNDVEINFGGVNFGDAPFYTYVYKLEGFDRDWISAGSDHEASYSNLPAGKYSFRVRALQSLGSEAIEEKSITLVVGQAPWLSVPALAGYVLLFAGLVVYINHLYLRIRSNRMALQLANADKERERRTNEMNMRFFANISHEFRNPLTLISGPVSTLYADSSLPASVHRKLAMVRQSVQTMLKLIDQMLDFNRLENDVLRLRVAQYDVVHEINVWADVFEETARERGITLQRRGLEAPCYAWLDHDKLDKILGNLFTNALKHTPDGGVIRLECEAGADGCLRIGVYNNGPYIPEEKLADVFKRYYQAKEVNGDHRYGWGTGIGLYYVQRLVQLHHGNIQVENVPEGGVAFRFVLPMGEEAYREDEHVQPEVQEALPQALTEPAPLEGQGTGLESKPKLLVVDDDVQLARYLRSLFGDNYRVENRYSAEAAWKDMEDIAPDLVVSDVIMGEMSGYDLCRKLKEDVAFSHIPVVLLTAKSQVDEQIEGLELGANAYVTKPFDPGFLKALVRSQLRNCENIRRLLSENVQTTAIGDGLSPQDRAFMDDLYRLMETHLSDLDLNLNTICEELRMSRSKFNYKMKGLTGETPNNFFKHYKLNCAARLLREGKNNVSEVALLTGFGTVSYFSVCFKKQFGVNPSEFR